jgi:chromate reductase
MSLRIFELDAIPPYNSDVEAAGDPEAVAAFKQAVRDADALLVATPEYNYGVPGVLKNAVDRASRPAGKSPLAGEPAAIMGASLGLGGTIRAQLQLRPAFLFTEVYALLKPELAIPRCQEKFDAEGRLTDEATRGQVRKLLEALRDWTLRLRGRPR